jgi:hypothetical protein
MELRARAGGRADAAAESVTTVSSTVGAADLESWIGGGQGERGGAAAEEPPRPSGDGPAPGVVRE